MKAKIIQYHQLQKTHKVLTVGTQKKQKVTLVKEWFFDLGRVRENSHIWEHIRNSGDSGDQLLETVNFKDIIQAVLERKLGSKSKPLLEYVLER